MSKAQDRVGIDAVCNAATLAKMLNVSPNRIGQLVTEGVIPGPVKPNAYSIVACVSGYVAQAKAERHDIQSGKMPPLPAAIIARTLNVDARKARKVLADVEPVERDTKGRPLYDLGTAARYIVPALAVPVGAGGDDGGAEPGIFTATDRNQFYKSKNEELAYRAKVGELVPVEDHRGVVAAVIRIIVAGYDSLPDLLELKAQLAGAQVEAARVCVDEQRDSMYHQLRQLGEDPEA